jgi:small subunit ribosomal protein S20
MPHTTSAKKRLRQTKKRQEHNLEVKKVIKIQFKQFLRAVKSGDKTAVQKEYVTCAKKLDKAAAQRIIHPNKAARKKSQLARMMNAPAAAPKS